MQDALLKLQVKNKLPKPPEEREARLHRMRGRLVAEAPEESEARLQRIANSHNMILPVCTNCPSSNIQTSKVSLLENVEHCGGEPEKAANMHKNRLSFTLK